MSRHPFSIRTLWQQLLAPLLLVLVVGALVWAQPVGARATLQSSGTPNLLSYGQSVEGTIRTTAGNDHLFTGCADETVEIRVTTKSFAPRLELYFADEAEAMASAVAASGENEIALSEVSLAESGQYAIVVSGRSRGDRGDYTLTLDGNGPDNALPDAPLPDNSGLTLNLAYGDAVEGTIEADSVHHWNFRGCAGDEILVEMQAETFAPEMQLLFPIAELPIATSETGDDGASAQLRHTLPSNGAYNLVVGGASDEDAGDYALTLTLEGNTPVRRATTTPTTAPTLTPTPTPTRSAESTPTPTETASGPRGRRGVPTPGTTTPRPTSTPIPTPTATFEFPMPGVGESAFLVFDVSSEHGPVNRVVYAPDGTLFATAGEDGVIRLWDAGSGEELLVLDGHEGRANDVAFTEPEMLVAGAGDDALVRIWNTDAEQIGAVEMPSNHVTSVEFSPDGSTLVATTDEGDVVVWDMADNRVRFALPGHAAPVYDATYSPDGQTIATGDGEGVVRLWDVESGEMLDSLPVNAGPGSGDPILSIAFNLDGSAIVVGGVTGINAGSVQVWDLASGDPLAELVGHREWGSSATISPDDAYILSAGRGEPGADALSPSTARLWSAESGELAVAFVGFPNSVVSATFSPFGDALLTSDGNFVYIWPAPMIDVLAAAIGAPVGVAVPVPQSTETPRSTVTPTVIPTRQPTVTPRPTATSTPTATATQAAGTTNIALEIFCTVIADRLNLRPGPGTEFNPPVDVLETGDLLVVTGRNADATWLQVVVLDVNLEVEAEGWVSADFVFCVGEIEDAPVVEVGA